MDIVKKFSPYISVALFVITIVSVFLGWVSLKGVDDSAVSLWKSEAGARLVIIVLSVVASAFSIAAATSMKDKVKTASGLNIAFAIVNLALGILFVMNQKSQAEDLGVPSELMGYGIGFMIMAITMVLAIIINIVATASSSSSAKATK